MEAKGLQRERRKPALRKERGGVVGQRRGEAAQPADPVRGAAKRSRPPYFWVGRILVLALIAPSIRST